jgi:hypothetical protein
MTASRRWLLLASTVLGAGLLAQWALLAHLAPANPEAYPHLTRPLVELPLTFSGMDREKETDLTWVGIDRPDLEKLRQILPFHADDLLSRVYRLRNTDLVGSVYIVHSRTGADRHHHPEICIREVTGAPEDLGARRTFGLEGDPKRPVQRFRFKTGTQQFTTVYYWHYTFTPPREATRYPLQQIHLRLGYPAPSLTVQVATSAELERLEPLEQSFLPMLDASLSSYHLPPVRMACDRMPITLIRH